nr:helix-turn-helix transcriptional regulator [Streptococcus sp. ZJ1593]
MTDRECEICQLLLEHKNNQEIADCLYLSIGTVKAHIHNIYLKMAIHQRDQIYSLFEDFQM